MQKVLKNIRISFDVMNLKQMIVTIVAVVFFVALLNIIISWAISEPLDANNITIASIMNAVSILVFFFIILLQVNTYRGLLLMKSFSMDAKDVSSYYVTTTIFYSIIIYIIEFVFIAFPFYQYTDLTNKFAFGYHLGDLSFGNYIAIFTMVYGIVLLAVMLFQLFTIVGLRFGTWVNVGMISLSIATIVTVILPILTAIRSGIDKWTVFGSIYVVSIIIFIICYYLQKNLEVTK